MSRHYKHSSAAQIIIHTQSPNSTACADANLWKNKFNRTVAGGKSIQVLTDDNTTSCLYDISQTCPISGKTAKMPWIWNLFDTTLKVSYSEAVKDGLIKKHSLSSAALPDCLSELCRKKTTEYLKEDSSDFFKLIYESASYCIKYRCCQNESQPCTENLSCLDKCSADTLINTVNHIVNEVFSDIESIILSEKRRLIENIRSNSHEHRNENNQRNTSREMSDNERISAGHDNGKRNDDDTGRKQVSVSPTGVQGDEAGRNNSEDERRSHNASSSVGNSGENLQNGTRSDKRRVRSSSTGGTGKLLSDRGKTLERKGDTDSSLKVHHSLQKLSSEITAHAVNQDFQQLQLFGSTDTEPDIVMSDNQNIIDHILKCGGNTNQSLERIVAHFQKNKSTSENAEFLRNEFTIDGRGYTFTEDDSNSMCRISAWFDNNGITYRIGNTAFNYDSSLLTWEQASLRISELLDSGEYCSQDIIDRAAEHEVHDIAERLCMLERDIDIDYGSNYILSKEIMNGTVPDIIKRVQLSFDNPDSLQKYIDNMNNFIIKYEDNRDILRFHFHKPNEILHRLKDLQIPRKEFTVNPNFQFKPKFFITEDEKDKLLTMGSGVEGGKSRIVRFFTENHTVKEKTDFLQNEYGFSGIIDNGFSINYDSHGLTYQKGVSLSNIDCEILMEWSEVAKRIDTLIAENRYINSKDNEKNIKVAESLPSAENTDPDVSVKTEESKTFEQSYNTAENTVVSLPEIITQTEVKEQSDKIEDFGKKIGGAKKDIWKTKYLTLSDITDWTEIEKEKYITKNNIWKAPDYQKLFDDGLPLYAVYFIKLVHDNLPAKPALNTQDFQNGYISVISDIRDKALQIKTEKDVRTFINGILNDYLINNKKNYGCFTTKFIRTKNTVYLLEQEISKKQFLYTDKQKALSNYCIYFYNGSNIAFEANRLEVHVNHGKHYFYDMQYNKKEKWIDNTYFVASKSHSILENNFSTLENAESFALQREQELSANKDKTKKKSRKKYLIPKQLQNVIRTGTDYRCGKDISGDDMLKTFGFYGGEFGNWENQIERQQNLNFSYEAFRDLAAALGIKDSDISLNGKLSIAFGARGKGNALAHFEPMRNVINLTKIKGAGSLAHEWGHAFDFFLASKIDTPFHFASQSNDDLIKPVIDSMIWKKLSPEENKALQLKLSEKCQNQFTDKVKHMFDYTNRSNNEKSDIDLAISQCISTFDESQYNLVSSGKFKFHDILNALTVKMNIKPMKFYSLNFYLIQSYAYMNENSDTECRMVHTDFYNDSVQMDKLYSKCDKGYWRSNIEMFARAFACYVADKLQPERSDYLCGHAESDFSVTEDKKIIYAFPRGTERETINKSFDKLFTLVKEREFLHTQEHETRSITQLTEKPSIRSTINDIQKNQNPVLQHSSKHQAISL